MQTEEVKALLEASIELQECLVKGDGSHYEVIAVGEVFEGLSRVKKQQLVYKPLAGHIANNSLHAVTIKAFTPDEWKSFQKLNMLG